MLLILNAMIGDRSNTLCVLSISPVVWSKTLESGVSLPGVWSKTSGDGVILPGLEVLLLRSGVGKWSDQ